MPKGNGDFLSRMVFSPAKRGGRGERRKAMETLTIASTSAAGYCNDSHCPARVRHLRLRSSRLVNRQPFRRCYGLRPGAQSPVKSCEDEFAVSDLLFRGQSRWPPGASTAQDALELLDTPTKSVGQTFWLARFTASGRSGAGGYKGKNIASLVLEGIWAAP